MKKILLSAALLLSLGALSSAQPGDKSWEGIHAADIPTLERNYALPPAGYASHILWGWEGAMDAKVIRQDLDLMQRVNTRVVNIEPGYDFPYEYLSDGWWKMVKTAVTEAKKRGMKVWLIDDAKYPSGFAGGKFSRERPDLKMWALVQLDEAGYVVAGEDCHTPTPGLFVAGDNRAKQLRQLVTATADGAMAATEAVKYINSVNM